MAQLKWDQVTVPAGSSSSSSAGIESVARLIGGGLGGMATALGQFSDRQALEQLSRYTDAQQLQRDLQSGTFNTGNASAEALTKIMGRPAALITDAHNQQIAAHTAAMNPLDQRYRQLEIDNKIATDPLNQETTRQTIAHNAVMNPLKETEKTLEFTRGEEARNLGLHLGQQWADYKKNNLMTPEAAYAFRDQFRDNPVAYQMASALITKEVPGFDQAIVSPSLGSIPGTGGTVPVAGQSATTVGSVPLLAPGGGISVPASATKTQAPLNLPTEVSSSLTQQEQSLGIPPGVLTSIVQQEVGGRLDEFLKDPAKYHYEPDASGNRKSTAFGPFGILESTAKDPGYGVKPLQDKSLPEQIRFASEYAAARAKDAGSWEKGLAGYGEGAKYAQAVIRRLNGQQAAAISNKVTQDSTTSRQLLQAANMFSDTGLMNSAAAAYEKDPEGLESDQAVATRMTGESGSLKGVDVNDTRSAIKQVQTELGVSAAVAGAIVERAVKGGILSSVGGLGVFDAQKIDFDGLGNLLDTIGGKRDRDGKYENRNKVSSVLDTLVKGTASENAKSKLDTSEKEIAEIAARIKTLEGVGTPAAQAAIAAENARLALAQARQAQALTGTGSAVQGLVGNLTPPPPPSPVATQPTSGAKPVNPRNSNFYSAENVAARAKVQAEQRDQIAANEAAEKAKAAALKMEEEQERKRKFRESYEKSGLGRQQQGQQVR